VVARSNSAATRRRLATLAAHRRSAQAGSARERILATADRLFYAEGVQAVGVQRMVDEAHVTRVTFYRHFPTKDDLVLAYLEVRADRARIALDRLLAAYEGNPRGALHAWAVAFAADGVVDEYRGCAFVNAAAEYGDTSHPVRARAIQQREWVNGVTERLLREAGHPEPERATRLLLALRTGYVFSAGLEEPNGWADEFVAAYDRIVDGGLTDSFS
jgi:AcrR family transcriptional regulator